MRRSRGLGDVYKRQEYPLIMVQVITGSSITKKN
jgi:hypothetical protein